MNTKKTKKITACLCVAILIFALTALLRQINSNYLVSILNTSMFYFICVAGLYITLGLGGILSMCSITLMGFGGFVCANLTALQGKPVFAGIICGTLLTGLVALVIAILFVRVKNMYFVFGTIAVTYIGSSIFQNLVSFTGGSDGIRGIPCLSIFGYKFDTFIAWFPLLCLISVLVLLLMYRIKNTALGRNLMAIRDNETIAPTLGVNVYKTKIVGFTISGLLAGFSGALYALHNGVISASSFTYNIQLSFLIAAMLGGIMSPVGIFAGCFIVKAIPELARSAQDYLTLVNGIAIVALMVFMPMGVAGIINELVAKHKHRANTMEAEVKDEQPES